MCIPSIDKDTHGFDGQKERPYVLKDLENTQSIPAALSQPDRISATAKLLCT